MSRFELYQDPSQWLTRGWWYWKPAGTPDGKGHGPYPLKTLARLAALIGMR